MDDGADEDVQAGIPHWQPPHAVQIEAHPMVVPILGMHGGDPKHPRVGPWSFLEHRHRRLVRIRCLPHQGLIALGWLFQQNYMLFT